VSFNGKMQNCVKKGYVGVSDPILKFWDPLISRERLELETSNLARRRTWVTSNEKDAMLGPRDPILEFWDPPKISRTVGARNFKFGTETDVGNF